MMLYRFASGSSPAHRSRSSLILSIAALGLLCLFALAGRGQDAPSTATDVPPVLKIGSPAPDFNLPGVDGKMHALKDYASSKVLVVIFNCDHCPIASMYERRIKQLVTDYQNRGVAVVVIMGNDPQAEHLSEKGHTDLGDSFAEMKLRAAYRHFNYPYLYDGDTQAVALKYGPTATPHAFIFDQQRILRYEGRIDSNAREELVTKHEARDAIDALLAGKPVAVQSTPAVGCSTKWAYKEVGAKAEIAEGDQKPVTLDMITADQLKAMQRNAGTGRLLLVNVWATSCSSCTEGFANLQDMIRMYAKRAIDIVTVSMDSPGSKQSVLSFLQQEHAIGKNLLFNGDTPDQAASAFGTDWKGNVPYTVLIGMNGEVLYRSQEGMGANSGLNALEVRRVILKNLPDDRYLGQHAYWNSSF
jgi:peroxiredoxin